MKFMIRCDVEGVTGVVHPSQASPHGSAYAYGVEMLHHDLNALLEGLWSTGEHEVWVYDMHYFGLNLDMRRLDSRVRVVCGEPPYTPNCVGGLTPDFDGQFLLGLHAKAGTGTLLAHSYEHEIEDIRLNGLSVGEIGLEAAMAGEMGVPTLLVTGDSAGCAEAETLIPGIPTVVVKESLGPTQAICDPCALSGARLSEGAKTAVAAIDRVAPFSADPPVVLEIQLAESPFTDHVRSRLAPSVQEDGSLRLEADSTVEAWRTYLLAKPPLGDE